MHNDHFSRHAQLVLTVTRGQDLGHGPGDFPNAEAAAAEIVSLPLFPGITEAQQDRVVDALVAAVA